MSAEEGFLSRWSRRKRAATEGRVVEEPPAPAAVPAPAAAEPVEAEAFDLSLLPDIETLTAESDLSLFLKKGVPAVLRQAALRRMWVLDPAIRDFIGPVDYQWDFNAPGGIPGISEALDGDVGRLLAQAIGAPPPDAAAPRAEVTEAPAEAKPGKSFQDAEESVPEQEVIAEPDMQSLRVAAPQHPTDAAPPRRRHGGAVPV